MLELFFIFIFELSNYFTQTVHRHISSVSAYKFIMCSVFQYLDSFVLDCHIYTSDRAWLARNVWLHYRIPLVLGKLNIKKKMINIDSRNAEYQYQFLVLFFPSSIKLKYDECI